MYLPFAQVNAITIGLVLAGALVLTGLLVVVATYNQLVSLRNRFKNAFSQIDVQLKRRYDLIPNLVETAKSYMQHEKETLERVIQARNQAYAASQRLAANPADPNALQSLNASEANLSGALGRFNVLAEAYPDLKANTNMLALQEELTSTENKIAFARQAFNDAITKYNTTRESFPTVLFSDMLGFHESKLLELESPKEREAPKVAF